MQPELHPAAEMEGNTWSTTRGKSTEAFLREGNRCFSDKEMPFCPSSRPIAITSQDRQRWRRALDEAAAVRPMGSAGGSFQTSRDREGNPKNRTKGGGIGKGGWGWGKKNKPNNPKISFSISNPSSFASLSPWRHSLWSPWKQEAWREHHHAGWWQHPALFWEPGRHPAQGTLHCGRVGGGKVYFCLVPPHVPIFSSLRAWVSLALQQLSCGTHVPHRDVLWGHPSPTTLFQLGEFDCAAPMKSL